MNRLHAGVSTCAMCTCACACHVYLVLCHVFHSPFPSAPLLSPHLPPPLTPPLPLPSSLPSPLLSLLSLSSPPFSPLPPLPPSLSLLLSPLPSSPRPSPLPPPGHPNRRRSSSMQSQMTSWPTIVNTSSSLWTSARSKRWGGKGWQRGRGKGYVTLNKVCIKLMHLAVWR